MSLNFGYEPLKIPEPIKIYQQNWQKLRTYKQLRYTFTYPATTSTDHVYPVDLRGGFPLTLVCGANFDQESKLTLLGHTFDVDNTLNVLDLNYVLRLVDKQGNGTTKLLKNIELEHKLLPKVVYGYYYAVLNETFLLKDYITDFKNLAFVNILIQRTSSFPYSNESALDVLFEY